MASRLSGRIDRMTWREAAEALAAGAPVVIPIGAAAKAHGPHLPLGTDWIVAEALGDALAARLPVLVAPNIGFGYYPAFVEYPGTLHMEAPAFQALAAGVALDLAQHGARRIAFLNFGVSTEGAVVQAAHDVYAKTGVRPAIAQLRLFGRAADAALDAPGGGHADERETSLMLHLAPDLVRMEFAPAPSSEPPSGGPPPLLLRPTRLANGREPGPGEASLDGATGDPSRATTAKGAAVFEALLADLEREMRRVFPEAPGFGPPREKGA